jgi:hypothetical protein
MCWASHKTAGKTKGSASARRVRTLSFPRTWISRSPRPVPGDPSDYTWGPLFLTPMHAATAGDYSSRLRQHPEEGEGVVDAQPPSGGGGDAETKVR